MITFLAVYRRTKLSKSLNANNINIEYGNTFQITADLLRLYKQRFCECDTTGHVAIAYTDI